MEALSNELTERARVGHGSGPCLRDQAGKNASGKGHEPRKLWPAGAKGRGPREVVLAPGCTGQVPG